MCHSPCGGSQTAETSVVDSFSLPQSTGLPSRTCLQQRQWIYWLRFSFTTSTMNSRHNTWQARLHLISIPNHLSRFAILESPTLQSEASKGLRSALTRQLQICTVGWEYHSLHFITLSERSVISSSPCVWPGALNTCNLWEEGPNKAVHWSPAFFFENPDLWIKTLACSTDLLHPFSIFEIIECGRPMRKRHVSEMTLKAGYLTQNPPVDQSEPAPTNAPTWMDSA